MLEKAATIKRFEYSSLGKELKAQTDIAKKQYQKSVCTSPFLQGGGWGAVEPPTKFSKGGGLTGSQFLGVGLLRKRG